MLKNTSELLKLSNGSIGFVVGFVGDPDESIHVVTNNGIQHHVHTRPPQVVYVQLIGYEDRIFLSGLPPGVAPVRIRCDSSVQIKMPARTFVVSVKQVPLIPAFALTSEKCQGLTVEKMILGPLRHPTRHAPQRPSFYVAVTTVKTLQQLYLMEPLSLQYQKYFKPRPDALQESRRLEALDSAG